MKWQVINGNNIDILKEYPDNHFDSIVTDPPYGIAFLGKDWDSKKATETTSKLVALQNLPSGMKHTSLADDLEFQYWMRDVFVECNRVLKPGGHLLAFSAARTYHHMAMAAQTAGFEIRDQLQWIYGSGFPKAQDIGKAIDKRGVENDFHGWKTALKPAHEPIVMARKPFKGSAIDNVLEHGVGALNIDESRVGDEEITRYPSNVIGEIPDYQKYFYCPKVSRRERHIGFDELPETELLNNPTEMHKHPLWDPSIGKNPHRLMAKIREHNKIANNHPTVKPVELMKYLIKLVTPAGGRVLDPFNGSGSTGMAAVELGYEYVGCELDPDYVEIANKRIAAWEKQHDRPANNLFEDN